jgi:hypothetical protein
MQCHSSLSHGFQATARSSPLLDGCGRKALKKRFCFALTFLTWASVENEHSFMGGVEVSLPVWDSPPFLLCESITCSPDTDLQTWKPGLSLWAQTLSLICSVDRSRVYFFVCMVCKEIFETGSHSSGWSEACYLAPVGLKS